MSKPKPKPKPKRRSPTTFEQRRKWRTTYKRKWRIILRALLGNRCNHKFCRETRPWLLTFDCIKPMGQEHTKRMGSRQRLCFYVQQYRKGNLQLLCEYHNNQKNDTIEQEQEQEQK